LVGILEKLNPPLLGIVILSGLIEGFCQNVSKLPMGINVAQIDVPFECIT
jgi:hypothetical protein